MASLLSNDLNDQRQYIERALGIAPENENYAQRRKQIFSAVKNVESSQLGSLPTPEVKRIADESFRPTHDLRSEASQVVTNDEFTREIPAYPTATTMVTDHQDKSATPTSIDTIRRQLNDAYERPQSVPTTGTASNGQNNQPVYNSPYLDNQNAPSKPQSQFEMEQRARANVAALQSSDTIQTTPYISVGGDR